MFPGNLDYKEQLEVLTSEPRVHEIAMEESSIQFSEEELSSLNFGDDAETDGHTLEEHQLDFHIGDTV
jgi:hypothetical protein